MFPSDNDKITCINFKMKTLEKTFESYISFLLFMVSLSYDQDLHYISSKFLQSFNI